jgi:AraC-like DNA-binding protein
MRGGASLEQRQQWMRERHAVPQPIDGAPNVIAFERHFTPKELAGLWCLDETTIRRLFQDETGVLRIGKSGRRDGKRDYVSLRIPESVAVRVHQERAR